MALNLLFYNIIILHDDLPLYGEEHMDELYEMWSDGRIAIPDCCMDPLTAHNMVVKAKQKGFRLLKDDQPSGNYFLAAQFMEGSPTFQSSWLRVYRDVAWDPRCPMGSELPPTRFPCMFGGFYYENVKVWEEAKQTLNAFNDVISECVKTQSIMPAPTMFDNFFRELKFRTLAREMD